MGYSKDDYRRIIRRLPIPHPDTDRDLTHHIVHSIINNERNLRRHPELGLTFRHPNTNPPWIFPGNFECWGFEEKFPKNWPQNPREASRGYIIWDEKTRGWEYGHTVAYPAFLLKHRMVPVCHGKNPCLITSFRVDPENMDAILGACWNCFIQGRPERCQIQGIRVLFVRANHVGWGGRIEQPRVEPLGGNKGKLRKEFINGDYDHASKAVGEKLGKEEDSDDDDDDDADSDDDHENENTDRNNHDVDDGAQARNERDRRSSEEETVTRHDEMTPPTTADKGKGKQIERSSYSRCYYDFTGSDEEARDAIEIYDSTPSAATQKRKSEDSDSSSSKRNRQRGSTDSSASSTRRDPFLHIARSSPYQESYDTPGPSRLGYRNDSQAIPDLSRRLRELTHQAEETANDYAEKMKKAEERIQSLEREREEAQRKLSRKERRLREVTAELDIERRSREATYGPEDEEGKAKRK